jgi:putative ABC transport system permease protein
VEETTLIAAIRKEAAAIDPAQPVYAVQSMEEYLTNSFSPSRFRAFLTTLFAALAALLAGVGIYGVMAYFVTERTHEIGIRIALGARKTEVLRMVLGQGMKLVGAGIAAGLILAVGLTRMIASLLFGVDALDPLTFAGVAAGMALLAAATICVPARRAMRVDPIVALRHE